MELQEAEIVFQNAINAKTNDKIDEAIELYSKIENTSFELNLFYAKAQFNLGLLLKKQNRIEEAEIAYNNVKREDRAETYASAQYNLGLLLEDQNRQQEAEIAYNNVKREDDVQLYAKAQLKIGSLLEDKNCLEEAEVAYKNVKWRHHIETYAKAQGRLGFLKYGQGEIESSKTHFSNIKRSDSGFLYAFAQYVLWVMTDNSIYLKHIKKLDDEEKYEQAQFKLGELEYLSEKPKLNSISDYWKNISEHSEWYPKVYYKKHLIGKVLSIPKPISVKLFEIFKKVDLLLNSLVIKNANEDLIAHYTSPYIAKLLIAKNTCGFEHNSKMRLNTIDLMNDPTEGEILNHYLNISSELISTNDQAFMGCFTLHHDSLNQFRLYGKENQKEGSGLSLILSNLFFEQENSFSNIRLQNNSNSITKNIEVKEGEDAINGLDLNLDKEILKDKVIKKLPLYRCIYIDPDSKLIEISHREEWTFCREAKSSKSDKWDNYSDDIKELRDEIREEFLNLENLIEPVYQRISEDIKLYSNEAEILAEILLPLRFLIKHMAFKEEQECRVVYVSQWDDEFIQYDESLKRFYIDYGQDVAMHLKKIYLGPHAVHEKSMFEYLCAHAKKENRTQHEVKIKISHNPLR